MLCNQWLWASNIFNNDLTYFYVYSQVNNFMGIAERSLISQQHKLLEKSSEFSQVNFTCVISFPFRTTVVQKGKLLKNISNGSQKYMYSSLEVLIILLVELNYSQHNLAPFLKFTNSYRQPFKNKGQTSIKSCLWMKGMQPYDSKYVSNQTHGLNTVV